GFFEESEQSADRALELEDQHEDSHIQMTTAQFTSVTAETFIVTTNFTYIEEDADQLEFILMVLIPLILLALLFVSVVILVSRYKRKRTKQGKYSVFNLLGFPKMKLGPPHFCLFLFSSSPIFEEDTPSVMEIEMEELDKWMNSMNRN
ncbi:TM154 protein, partial [Crocuta crocuta]